MAQTRPVEEGTTDQAVPVPSTDLDSPLLYLNRELTWLAFNRRVLAEAEDAAEPAARAGQVPRHHGVEPRRVLHEAHRRPEAAGRRRRPASSPSTAARPQQQIAECYADDPRPRARQPRAARASCSRALARARHPHRRRTTTSTAADQRRRCASYYCKNIFPLVTPLAMDPAHPFPFISNLSLNLLVTVRYPNDTEPLLARVKVPVGAGIPRFLRVGDARTLRRRSRT